MTKNLAFLIALASLALVGCSSTKVQSGATSQTVDDGMPFGKITDSDTDQLMQFAKGKGFDLSTELQKAYAKDTNALARIFGFSMTFESLDQNARTYGQVIYSSFLNLGETMGPEQYSSGTRPDSRGATTSQRFPLLSNDPCAQKGKSAG